MIIQRVFYIFALMLLASTAAVAESAVDFKISAPATWKKAESLDGEKYFDTRSHNHRSIVIKVLELSDASANPLTYPRDNLNQISDARSAYLQLFGIENYSILNYNVIQKNRIARTEYGELQAKFTGIRGEEIQSIERRFVIGNKLYLVTYFEAGSSLSDLSRIHTILDFFKPNADRYADTESNHFLQFALGATIANAEAGEAANGAHAVSAPSCPSDLDYPNCKAGQRICAGIPKKDLCDPKLKRDITLPPDPRTLNGLLILSTGMGGSLASIGTEYVPITNSQDAQTQAEIYRACGSGFADAGKEIATSTIGMVKFGAIHSLDVVMPGFLQLCTADPRCARELDLARPAVDATPTKESYVHRIAGALSHSWAQYGTCLNAGAQARLVCKYEVYVAGALANGPSAVKSVVGASKALAGLARVAVGGKAAALSVDEASAIASQAPNFLGEDTEEAVAANATLPKGLKALQTYFREQDSEWAHTLRIENGKGIIEIGRIERVNDGAFIRLLMSAIKEGSISEIDAGSVVGPKVLTLLVKLQKIVPENADVLVKGSLKPGDLDRGMAIEVSQSSENLGKNNPQRWTERDIQDYEDSVKSLHIREACQEIKLRPIERCGEMNFVMDARQPDSIHWSRP